MLTVLSPVLVMMAVAFVVVVVALACAPQSSPALALAAVGAGCAAGEFASSAFLRGETHVPSTAAAVGVVACVAAYAAFRPAVAPMGAALWVSWLGLGITAVLWSLVFLSHLHLSATTTVLLWTTVCLAGVTLPSAVVTTREGWEALWCGRLPRPLPRLAEPGWQPMVSIHVPCHAEPNRGRS